MATGGDFIKVWHCNSCSHEIYSKTTPKFCSECGKKQENLPDGASVLDGSLPAKHDSSEPRRSDFSWIQHAADRMQHYWSLIVPAEVARTDNDRRLVEILEQFKVDKRKLETLKIFASCLSLVEWIRKETTDINDLYNFVSIALYTSAGEGDFSCDLLSHLKIVGSGFEPLIYGLNYNPSFQFFLQNCEHVWKATDQTPNLPRLLIACNDNLEWYKSVKEIQACLEVTPFGQMNNIFEYGWYVVGSHMSHISQNYEDTIKLTLKAKHNMRLTKILYTHEELSDLVETLVLITGSKFENRRKVDIFIDGFHSICRIAKVLLILQQVGNVNYTGWVLQVRCLPDILIDSLQLQARLMEEELWKWQEKVKKLRENCYELNYFTTSQLLTLRKELMNSASISPDVLALLQSVSAHVSASDVVDAVNQALQELTLEPVATVEESSNSLPKGEPTTDTAKRLSFSDTTVLTNETQVGSMQLTEDSLTEEQKGYVTTICMRLDCPRELVLMSFDQCQGEYVTRFDYERWCAENIDKYSFEGSTNDNESESCEENSDSSPVSEECNTMFTPLTIKVARKAEVDESHPDVVKLIKAGYTEKRSIAGIAKYGNFENAIDHMVDSSDEEDDEDEIIFSPFSREDVFEMKWDSERYMTIYQLLGVEEEYLKLECLGTVLKLLAKLPGVVQLQRTFPSEFLKEGYPNLIVEPPENILRTVLSIYMTDYNCDNHPLPTQEEVLICYPTTTAEEVEIFWRRAVKDPQYKRIFTLVHAEKLTYQVSDEALSLFSKLSQGQHEYRLVIVCSKEGEKSSYFISKLDIHIQTYVAPSMAKDYQDYLSEKFCSLLQPKNLGVSASAISWERSCVRIVKSDRSGMGKSLHVRRLAECLQPKSNYVSIPLHGPVISRDAVLELLQDHLSESLCYIIHIDIAPNILWQVDTILFSLLILRGLSDSQGRIWRCYSNQFYAIEVTISARMRENEQPENRVLSILDIFPSVSCLSPKDVLSVLSDEKIRDNSFVLMDVKEFRSDSYQRVYQYIRCYDSGADLNVFSYKGTVEESPHSCLELLLRYCGVINPSWSEIHHFVEFLDLQLVSCENSIFTNLQFKKDMMTDLKGLVVKYMLRMAKDFSTLSFCEEFNEEKFFEEESNFYRFNVRKFWEQSLYSYIFFNKDKVSITFVGFNVTKQGDLIDPENKRIMESTIMSKKLYEGLKVNGVNFDDDHRKWTKFAMIGLISTVLGVQNPQDPDKSYVLTADNVIKILAIQMRFRCGIPVVIMGETGCGKTSLIRYMCALAKGNDRKETNNMLILKVHGGTTEEDVTRFIKQAEKTSKENYRNNLDTVVLFDMVNTTTAIALIKEIMCDRRIKGKPVSDDLKFIATCNPYRVQNKEMIMRFDSASLKFLVKPTGVQQKLGKIPLYQLVYRVLDLPPSMRPLVHDFGQLNTKTECDYIRQIVEDHISRHPELSTALRGNYGLVFNVLVWSETYMRKRKDECSFVSLRDVKRAMLVFEYMYSMMNEFGPRMDMWAEGNYRHEGDDDDDDDDDDKNDFQYTSPGRIARALVLSLSVCYHSRLERREEYEAGVVKQFTGLIRLPQGSQQFRDEIRWCQEVILDSMHVDENIAKNAALRENVFVMAICMQLKIPLFLVGKPGSSKSLAKSIVIESMRGKDSRTDLLKNFKEVTAFSYQCSQLSTPESVKEVFNTASKYQAKQEKNSIAVVVLDEVGLAEDSPNLPLSALHFLLEDGTEGTKRDFSDELILQEDRVAFIGISNWALDPALMNRGVMVTRADPSQEELVFSAKGICSVKENNATKAMLDQFFVSFAQAYISIYWKQPIHFFGLRDFYSLIKMLYHMCKFSGRPPTRPQLEHAIKRNFGGLDLDEWSPYSEFEKVIFMDRNSLKESLISDVGAFNPDCSELGLIKASLAGSAQDWQRCCVESLPQDQRGKLLWRRKNQ